MNRERQGYRSQCVYVCEGGQVQEPWSEIEWIVCRIRCRGDNKK